MKHLKKQEIKKFQREILGWFEKNKRDLPWRRTREPYRILISEVMLQRTQVSRVIPKCEKWLEAFPTVEDLANARAAEVLQLWSGLGYNRRALYLKKAAEMIVTNAFQKTQLSSIPDMQTVRKSNPPSIQSVPKPYWPQSEKELLELPGVGKYTARAILCFAFDKQVAVVDTNVRKVILTKFSIFNFKLERKIVGIVKIAELLGVDRQRTESVILLRREFLPNDCVML